MIVFVSDLFKEIYSGGAELTSDAIIQDSFLPVKKILSTFVNMKTLEDNKDKFWIFSNFSALSDECLFYIAKNIKYATLEYDYKYCKDRLPELHEYASKSECHCGESRRGKLVSIFLKSAKATFWMSQQQRDHYIKLFPFLGNHNNITLSSVFSKKSLQFFKEYQDAPKEKNDKWLILGSQSWVKGLDQSIKYAKDNKLKYEVVQNLTHDKFLKKLSESRGIIFLPKGRDTCPRFVIEAFLLGCEMILNENVQHKEEEWFKDPSSCLEYLDQRTDIFWREVSKYVPNIPHSSKSKELLSFKIIIPFYNASKWIEKCIKSVQSQNYNNFSCYLIDDISTDDSMEIALKAIEGDDRFCAIRNDVKKYALRNIHDAIEHANPNDDDVIILLDGDDWLSCYEILSKLNDAYQEHKCLLTYGSYVAYPSGFRGVEPSKYSSDVVKYNLFREDKWRASHLRTFKYVLWRNLDKRDLKHENGEFFQMTYDQAIMLPMLEMASERILYIDEIMHVYNRQNPLNVDKIKAREQYKLACKIRKKSKYERLEL